MSFEKHLREKFQASLSFMGEEKQANFDITHEDSQIEKIAGEYLKDATEEIVEQKVKELVRNEIKQIPETVAITTFQVPNIRSGGDKNILDSSTGYAVLKYNDVIIKLPFIYRDNTIEPFEVIQIEGRRIPYSREALVKTLQAIGKNYHKQQDGPYLGLADRTNPATSNGFMGDVLRVRELTSNNNTKSYLASGTKLATEQIEQMFDKVASLKELTDSDIKDLLTVMSKSVADKALKTVDKENEDYKKEVIDNVKIITELEDIRFSTVDSVEDGEYCKIIIREDKKNGAELSFLPVKVFKNVKDILGKGSNVKAVIISKDSRALIVKKGEEVALVRGQAPFTISTKYMNKSAANKLIMFMDADKLVGPVFSTNALMPRELTPYRKYDKYYLNSYKDKKRDGYAISDYNNLYVVNSDKISYLETSESKALELADTTNSDMTTLKGIKFGEDKDTVVIGAKSPIIVLESVIENVVRDSGDLFKQAEYAEASEIGFEKLSSTKPKIKITVKQKDNRGKIDKVDVSIEYADKSKALFRTMQKDYRNLSFPDMLNLLRYVGFEARHSAEIVNKLKMSNTVTYYMPRDIDFNMLQGANIKNISLMKTKNVVNNIIKPKEIGLALAASLSGTLIADGLKAADNIDKTKLMGVVNKLASDASTASAKFEKIAMEKESFEAKDIALSCALANNYFEKLASHMLEDAVYPQIVDVSRDILSLTPGLEKIATDLLDLKITQKEEENEIIPDSFIKLAMDTVSNLYSISYNVAKTRYDMEKVASEVREETIEKIAGAVKGAAIGGLLGGATSSSKVKEEALSKNPMALQSDYAPEQAKKTAKGLVVGGAVGAGAGTLMQMLKKTAELAVPTEEEKDKANNQVTDDALLPISCKECGFEGDPNYDGRCPKCGAIAGEEKETKENTDDKIQSVEPLEDLSSAEGRQLHDRMNFY